MFDCFDLHERLSDPIPVQRELRAIGELPVKLFARKRPVWASSIPVI